VSWVLELGKRGGKRRKERKERKEEETRVYKQPTEY
jgi:hypothetical protein